MWVISGPFDGEVVGEVGFEKPKLLKPSTSYTVGRKDKDIVINSKKISQNHCDFIVGEYTVDHAGDYTFRPTLEILNTNNKDKSYTINRGEGALVVPQNEKAVLESGDSIVLVSGTTVRVDWRPIYIFYPPVRGKSSVSSAILNGCASLGIKLSQKMHEKVTHHLAAHYVANLTTAASLLNLTRIVKPEWLNEIIRLGALPRSNENSTGTSLEDKFILPLETKFRPSFSPSLLPKQKTFDVWEPNEERVNFFTPFRFICMQEKATDVDSDIREVIIRGGGSFEILNVTDEGLFKFHRALSRGQAKQEKKTVVVGDIDSLQTAVGNSEWKNFVLEARSYSTDIFSPSKIAQSVIEINISLLEVTTTDSPPRSSPLPEKVPNSIPEEPSMQPEGTSQPKKQLSRWASRRNREPPAVPEPESPPKKRPLRRATSPPPDPAEAPAESESPPRKRPLRRATSPPEPSVEPESDNLPRRRPLRRVADEPPEPAGPSEPERRVLGRRRFARPSEPTADIPEPPSPPRRVLTRRVDLDGEPIITGLEDPSMLDSDTSTSVKKKTPPPARRGYAALLDIDDKEDAERLKRLKRRQDALKADSESMTAGTTGVPDTLPEPPLKKFKALFDSTRASADTLAHFATALNNPDLDVEAIVNSSQTQTQTETQGQGQSRGGRMGRTMGVSSLAILREEEEETQGGPAPRGLRGAKRARLDSAEENEIMAVDAGSTRSRSRAASSASTGTNASASAAKKRAVENFNAVQRAMVDEPAEKVPSKAVGTARKPPSTFNSREEKGKAKEREKEMAKSGKQAGASSSKMDTDEGFLKAIASKRRGKEDEFDREFNGLKIRKPVLDEGRRKDEEEWDLAKGIEVDPNSTGNYMKIIDLEPYKKDEAAIEAARQKNSNSAWDGLPNFKKFKQKQPSAPKPKIELFVSQDESYGMGPSYWKSGSSQNETQGFTQMTQTKNTKDSQRSTSKKAGKAQSIVDSDDEDDGFSTGRWSRKPASKAGSVASSSKRATTSKAKAPAKNALFLDSDDDIQEVDEQSMVQGSKARPSRYTQEDGDFDTDLTLQSTSELKVKGKGKAPVASKRTVRPAAKGPTKPAILTVDSDSDDAVFKGFTGKKVGR